MIVLIRATERGAICPRVKGGLINYHVFFILFRCVKGTSHRGSLQGSKHAPDSVPQIPLLSAPSARLKRRGLHFAVLPLGLKNLSADLVLILILICFHRLILSVFSPKEAESCISNLNCSSKHHVLVAKALEVAIEKKLEDGVRIGQLLCAFVKSDLVSLESFKQGYVVNHPMLLFTPITDNRIARRVFEIIVLLSSARIGYFFGRVLQSSFSVQHF